jgi:hypothetical protein
MRLFLPAGMLLAACLHPCTSDGEVRLIGCIELREVPADFGGISGIDYDPRSDRWLAVTDDKANPRYYTLSIDYDEAEVRGAVVEKARALELPKDMSPDVESIRLSPSGDELWYANEGSAEKGSEPAIVRVPIGGGRPSPLPLPPRFGYRNGFNPPNEAIEALSFVNGTDFWWAAAESPLRDDARLVRFTEYRGSALTRQFAHRLTPVPDALARGRMARTGVAEILAVSRNRLFSLERAGALFDDGWRYAAWLVGIDLASGGEVDAAMPLREQPAARRWIAFDFAGDGRAVDNLEGIAFGRRLASGAISLIVISDNNFEPKRPTQIWVLKLVIPAS